MSEREIPEELEQFVYEPDAFHKRMGAYRHDNRCSHKLHGGNVFYQCSRKPKQTVRDFGFCTQHAKMVRKRLEEK